jgi:hypothetical protein
MCSKGVVLDEIACGYDLARLISTTREPGNAIESHKYNFSGEEQHVAAAKQLLLEGRQSWYSGKRRRLIGRGIQPHSA